MSNLLALNGEIAPAPTVGVLQRGVLRRPVELTGAKRTLSSHRKSVAPDPSRHFAALNCRSAKGSLDHVGGGHKQGLQHSDPWRSLRLLELIAN